MYSTDWLSFLSLQVSNSEMRPQDPNGGIGKGGVGALTFDSAGNLLHYDMILKDTTWNCGGGRTPWNTWIRYDSFGIFVVAGL